jgi:hypothetical protein
MAAVVQPSADILPIALTLCYGGDKAHMYTVAGGMASVGLLPALFIRTLLTDVSLHR